MIDDGHRFIQRWRGESHDDVLIADQPTWPQRTRKIMDEGDFSDISVRTWVLTSSRERANP